MIKMMVMTMTVVKVMVVVVIVAVIGHNKGHIPVSIHMIYRLV